MAKKIAVRSDDAAQTENGKLKKKRGLCCTCCLIFVVALLVIFAAAFGIGWYFGDKFTRENLGLSLSETLGVLNDLYWTDDSDVVKNPYSAKDVDGFYTQIKRNVFLKDDAEIDFDGALLDAVDKYLNGDVAVQSDDGEQAENDGSITDIFVNMISGVLNRDNIDLNRLNGYDEFDADTDEYIFELNDKQLAAFVNAVLKAVLADAEKTDMFGEVAQMVTLKDVVSLKQIRFKAKSQAAEDGVSVITASTADITVWLGLQNAAGQAASYFLKQNGFGWASGLVGWLGDVILPENIYITMTVPLYGDAQSVVTINDMNDKERAKANKLINGIMSMSGSGMSLEDLLNKFTDKIKPYLESAAEKMSFDGISDGTISLDLLDMLMGVASQSFEGDPLTKADFIYLLQAVLSDPSSQLKAIQPYRYQNRYIGEDGKSVYIEGGSTELTPIDYEKEFIAAIEDKYSVDFNDDASLADVLAMLGVSLSGSGEMSVDPADLCDIINAERLNASLDKDLSELELTVTDRMLAAALASQLDTELTGNGTGFEELSINLDAFTFIKKPEKPNNMYAYIVVEINLEDMLLSLGGDSVIKSIASGLMPQTMLLTVTVDITRSRVAGEVRDEAEFVINSCANTDRALDTLGKLLPELDIRKIVDQIESMLDVMLDQMYKKLNVRLVASSIEYDESADEFFGEQGAIILPDIFTVVTDVSLVDESGERVVSPEQLKDVLRAINDTGAFSDVPQIAESYSGFIAQVVDKYYLKPDDGEAIETFDALTDFMTEFDTSKFRISGEDGAVKYLAHDTREVAELKPLMTDKELGALIEEQIANNDSVGDYRVMDVITSPEQLSVVLSISVGDLLPDDVKFLLVAENLFVTATVDLTDVRGDGEIEPKGYSVGLKINEMTDETYNATLDIVRFFTPEFDIQAQVDEFGVILYDELNSLNISISPDVDDMINGDADASLPDIEVDDEQPMYEFTDEGLVMIDFYTFLSNKMKLELDEETTSETVKSALQGMYMRSAVEGLYNENNYIVSDILRNADNVGDEWTDEQCGQLIGYGGTYSDVEFTGFFKNGVESIDLENQVHVEQTVILHKGDSSAAAENVRAWVNARTTPQTEEVTADDEYMLITFSMTMDKYMESNNDDAKGFYPQIVYATMVFKKTFVNGYDDFTQIDLIFNDMTYKEYDVIYRLMSLSEQSSDESKVNILTVSKRSAEVLDSLAKCGSVEFGGKYGEQGIGSIVFTPYSSVGNLLY